MDINHLKQKFIDEADSLLTKLDNVLVEFEKSHDRLLVTEIFRIMHTIKGAAGMFGVNRVVEVTHELESLYDLVRNDVLPISTSLIELTFIVSDHVRELLVDENLKDDHNQLRHFQIIENIQAIRKSEKSEPASPSPANHDSSQESHGTGTWHILFYPSEELIKRCINMTYTFQDLFALGSYQIANQPSDAAAEQFWSIFLVTAEPYDEIENALMFVMDYCKITKIADFDIFDAQAFEKRLLEVKDLGGTNEGNENVAVVNPELMKELNVGKENSTALSGKNKTTRIHVEATKLDRLMYLVSELVTTKSELLQALHKKNEFKALDAAEKIEKLSKQFSDNALSIRLVSLNEMLQKFNRLIRDLSKQLGKKIEFVTVGKDTELDKNIIDTISEPILHLIRNNIDHGIELPDQRIEKGKPEVGQIRIEASKSGNYVYISISDDGNGIDTDFVCRKAIDKGFISEKAQLSDKEILNLIFLPGFSTAESLSDVSGRGVGMDIVLKKIQEIRGEIEVTTQKGVGTKFILKLQQSVSIIDTLLVVAGPTTFAFPIEDIESCSLEPHENITNRQNNLIPHDNELIPYVNFRTRFGQMPTSAIKAYENLIVIKRNNKRYAVVVDRIIGEFQAVIKPLGKAFTSTPFLSGASLLGDGSIALLVDPDKLWLETAYQ